MRKIGVRAASWILLLAALAITLGLETRTAGLLPGHHGNVSSKALTLARDLSLRYHFLLFVKKSIDAQGQEHLQAYNSFPILSFALLGAVMSLQSDDPAAEIRSGRLFMLLFFWGALAVSYRFVLELTGRPLLAVAAALLSCSSTTMQYYDDMIFNDIPALFGVVLLLLGIAVVERGGSGRLLWAAVFLSIALGWQGFAPLACWWILTASTTLLSGGAGAALRAKVLLRHRATAALVVALGWGGTLLAANLISEKLAMKEPFAELPSVRSMKFRLGAAPRSDDAIKFPELRWDRFLSTQARRLMKATIPTRTLHRAADRLSESTGSRTGPRLMLLFGAVLAASALLGWRFLREPPVSRARLALGAAVLCGPLWIVGMRNFAAFHEFQSLFYLGTVVVFYAALLSRLPDRFLGYAAVAALGIYAWSCVDINRLKTLEGLPGEARTRDFAAIRERVGEDRRILVGRAPEDHVEEDTMARYYISGNYFAAPERAEFLLSNDPREASASLTPRNQEVFLFPYSPAERSPRADAPGPP